MPRGRKLRSPTLRPVLEFCARVVLVEKPRYREPRWSTLLPPEVHEFRSPAMRRALADERRAFGFELLQVEYTQLAAYAGDVLVEHDVTFDLFAQILGRARTLAAWWDWFRWRRFETRALRRYRRVVVMSKKDAALLGPRGARRGDRKRRGPGALPSPRPSGPASACSSSAPSATSPISRPTASSPPRSGRCCARSFPGSS